MKTLSEIAEMVRGSLLHPSPVMRACHIAALVILLAWAVS